MLCKLSVVNPKSKRLFVFFNGFGADYKYWDDLLPYFFDENYVLLSENYFKSPDDHDIEYLKKICKGKKLIGIGHSLGYHKLCDLNKKYEFFKLNKIVSIEGFSQYLGSLEPMRSIRRFFLDLMKIGYTCFPKLTLSNFMLMCGAPMLSLPSNLNQDVLMNDLDLLYSSIESPKIPHLVLSSFDDWVIPFNIVEDNFRLLEDVKIIYTLGAGHLLGMKFPKYVSQEIKKFAES